MARAVGRIEIDEFDIEELKKLNDAEKIKYFKALRLSVASMDDKIIKEAQKGSKKKILTKKELFTLPKDAADNAGSVNDTNVNTATDNAE